MTQMLAHDDLTCFAEALAGELRELGGNVTNTASDKKDDKQHVFAFIHAVFRHGTWQLQLGDDGELRLFCLRVGRCVVPQGQRQIMAFNIAQPDSLQRVLDVLGEGVVEPWWTTR